MQLVAMQCGRWWWWGGGHAHGWHCCGNILETPWATGAHVRANGGIRKCYPQNEAWPRILFLYAHYTACRACSVVARYVFAGVHLAVQSRLLPAARPAMVLWPWHDRQHQRAAPLLDAALA
jgi:hypothetical protein